MSDFARYPDQANRLSYANRINFPNVLVNLSGPDARALAYCTRSGASNLSGWTDFFRRGDAQGIFQSQISYWSFAFGANAGTGTIAYDAIAANNNDLTLVNGPTWATDSIQTVLASSQYLTRADNASLKIPAGAFAVAFWHRNNALGTRQFLVCKAFGSGAAADEYYFECTAANALTFAVRDSSGPTIRTATSGTASNGSWQFIVGQWNPTTLRAEISVNAGTVATSAAFVGTPLAGTQAFQISGLGGSILYASANFNKVGFWKRYLSTSEIQWLYSRGPEGV